MNKPTDELFCLVDLTPGMNPDDVTIDQVLDRIKAALKYSSDLYEAGGNPEYWRGRIDALCYALSELQGVTQ
ncbi:MAG: hypothetical protein AB7S77_18620 [Desulfatirhabdiaceae bacterium]